MRGFTPDREVRALGLRSPLRFARRLRWLIPVCLLVAGCKHAPSGAFGLGIPNLPIAAPNLKVQMPEAKIALPSPPIIDFARLDFDEFFPPGAHRIGPAVPLPVVLRDTPRAQYPSDDLCVSPDGEWTLLYDGSKRTRNISHWLVARRRNATFPNALFVTLQTFHVLWSPDSQHVSITHFVGDNRSEVQLVDMLDLSIAEPLDLTPALEGFFTAVQIASPRFLKAYRWTDTGRLVVRGVGRESIEPYNHFGYEVLVEPSRTGPARMTLRQGFTRENRAAP